MKVFSALEATQDRGHEFAGAVRHLLQVCFPLSRVFAARVLQVCFPRVSGVFALCPLCHTCPSLCVDCSGRTRGLPGSRAAARRVPWSGGLQRHRRAPPTPT